LIRTVVDAARLHGRHVSVCGEAAADPLAGPLLVGLGVDELSVAPSSIASVRAALEGLELERCREVAARACAAGSVAEVRSLATALLER
jgi:phosphoenolpyruvate-protein kinase (PTS system EI component)